MEYVALLAFIIVLAVLFSWRVSAERRVFVIHVRNRVPFLKKGKVSQAFVAELAEVIARNAIRRGSISGVRRRGTVTLTFSRGIPQNARQSLRNVWSMHGR